MSNTTKECNPGLDCNNGNDVNCCRSKVACKKPQSLSDVSTECIFVEKVFDARLSKGEAQFLQNFLEITIEPTNIVSIETINVECNVLSFETIITNVNINGEFIDISSTVPGPGGTQVVLNRQQLEKILNPNCTKEGKGTKVQLDILLAVDVTFEIIVTGTGIDSNGLLVPFTGSDQINLPPFFTLSFKDFCIPPLSLFPISLITSCLLRCFFELFDFQFVPDLDRLDLLGQLIFCNTCQTLLKVPSQLCALTTGPCKIKESKAFCTDNFPDTLSTTPNPKKNTMSTIKKTNGCTINMIKKASELKIPELFNSMNISIKNKN